jgi:uncharacterized membrane protein YqgA involved in biofilm formation
MPIGIIIGSISVFLGGIIGTLIRKKINKNALEQLPSVFGMAAIAISITLIVKIENLTPVILALIVGTIIGETLEFEQSIKKYIEKIVLKSKDGNKEKVEMLITVIVLFCFSGTGIFGALNEGFTGDSSILIAKSAMDLFTAIIFGASVGYAVSLVAIPQFIIAMILFFSANIIVPLLSPSMLNDFKGCGGVITLAAGLKVSNIKSMRVINILPALFLVILLSKFWGIF